MKVKRILKGIEFNLKKNSPKIFLVAGVVGVVTSSVMACKATLKLNDILDEKKEIIEKIKETADNEDFKDSYTEKDKNRDLCIVYYQAAVELGKLYIAPISLGLLSIGCIIHSHNILNKRNIATSAAYASLYGTFKAYKERVKEKFGEQAEKEIRYDVTTKDIEIVAGEDNKKTFIKDTVPVLNSHDYSEHSKFFDSSSVYYEKNPEYNLMFLRAQEKYANDRLRAEGYLFLNDVYDSLGIPRTKAGQIVGWIYDEQDPSGDNHVDFGIYESKKECNRDFVNGYESVILLDFNVDGNIWDKM